MKNNLLRLSTLTILAGLLFSVPAAKAAFNPIPLPNSTYTSSTTLIPITGPDGDTILALSDANLTVTFSTAMQKFTVPDSWTNWNSAPNTETSTPRVLSPADFTLTSITLNFSQPLATFGLEAEPDATTQGAFPVTLDFFNGLTLLGTVTRTIDGSGACAFRRQFYYADYQRHTHGGGKRERVGRRRSRHCPDTLYAGGSARAVHLAFAGHGS